MVSKASVGYASTLKFLSVFRDRTCPENCDVGNQYAPIPSSAISLPADCQHVITVNGTALPHIELLSTIYVVKTFHRFPYHQSTCSSFANHIDWTNWHAVISSGSKKLRQDPYWQSGWMPESKTSDPSSSLGHVFFIFPRNLSGLRKRQTAHLRSLVRSGVAANLLPWSVHFRIAWRSRDSSVGRALYWRSKTPRFDPGPGKLFAMMCPF